MHDADQELEDSFPLTLTPDNDPTFPPGGGEIPPPRRRSALRDRGASDYEERLRASQAETLSEMRANAARSRGHHPRGERPPWRPVQDRVREFGS